MNYINRIEIQGTVAGVQSHKVTENGLSVYRFSVALNYIYEGQGSAQYIDTTWVNATVLETKAKEYAGIVKGAPIHLTGRLRNVRFTTNDGKDFTLLDIVVEDILPIKD